MTVREANRRRLRKLTDSAIREIRMTGINRRVLARKYRVTPQTIDNVRSRRTWA